jgi:outer membrane receptor for ferrienterochelin and colicins
VQSLIGRLSYFQLLISGIDNNHDGFTDVTLQNRISVFNKWNFERKNRIERFRWQGGMYMKIGGEER